MAEENKEQNLPGDEAPVIGWKKPRKLAYYTRTIADTTGAMARLYAKYQNPEGAPVNHDTQGGYTYPSFPEDIIPSDAEIIFHTTAIRSEEYKLITRTAKTPQPGETPAQAALRGSLSIAIIGFMRDTLMDPDEAASAEWSSLERNLDGSGNFNRPPSILKQYPFTDYISERTMTALDEMQRTRQVMGLPITENRIFQMDARQLSAHISVACSIANLEGRYNGHSPMLGMALDLDTANPDPTGIPLLQLGAPRAISRLLLWMRNSQN